MIELLAFGSSVLWGWADFLGGLTARRAHVIPTVFWSQFVGLVLMGMVLPFLPAATVSSSDWVWGFVGGLSGGICVALLYRALAVGAMAVVALTTAVIAAMIPVVFAFVMGERLPPLTLAGVALALVGIALVSRPASDSGTASGKTRPRGFPPGFGLALLSGVAVGIFFLSLARTTPAARMLPFVAARILSIGLFRLVALFTRRTVGS